MYRVMKSSGNAEVRSPIVKERNEKPKCEQNGTEVSAKEMLRKNSDPQHIKQATSEQINRLTPKQRTILKETYGALEEDGVKNALKVLVRLFAEYPRYKLIWPQFRAIPDSSLMHAIELKRHASVYMSGLGSIIHSMDDPDALAQQLNRIARAHIKWNIHRSHVVHMLQPVLEVLKENHGHKMSQETKEAWTTLYEVIADLIEIYRNQSQNVQLLSYA